MKGIYCVKQVFIVQFNRCYDLICKADVVGFAPIFTESD